MFRQDLPPGGSYEHAQIGICSFVCRQTEAVKQPKWGAHSLTQLTRTVQPPVSSSYSLNTAWLQCRDTFLNTHTYRQTGTHIYTTMSWKWRSSFVRPCFLPNSTLFWRQWENNQQGDDANNSGALTPRTLQPLGVWDPAEKVSRKKEGEGKGESSAPRSQRRKIRGVCRCSIPQSGPRSSAQSVALEPMCSCEGTLTLLSTAIMNWWAVVHVFYVSMCVLLHRSVFTYWVRQCLELVL